MDFRRPAAEVEIDEALVRRLLADQHPDLADRPLGRRSEGWDNVTWRLGPDLALRVPRRAQAVDLIRHEQRWLPEVAPRLGVSVSEPVRTGVPDADFPWPWSVVRWIDGETADATPLATTEAVRVAEFLRALHRPTPPEAPVNPFRSVPLAARAEFVVARIDALAEMDRRADADALREAWRHGVGAESARRQVWVHGDLHPRNVVVRAGRLAGVIDWGDMAAGDAAVDLACAWMLFADEGARAALWDAYGVDDPLVARAGAWAVFFGVALATTGDADHEAMGWRILEALGND